MPGNVSLASPSLVFPKTLHTSFVESRSYPTIENDYHDNTIQRGMIVYTSPAGTDYDPPRARPLRRWSLSKRLGRNILNGVQDPEDKFETLRDFWLTVQGGLYSFYFYYVPSSYDPTGANATNRATVVFNGTWSQTFGPVMTDVPLELVEIA